MHKPSIAIQEEVVRGLFVEKCWGNQCILYEGTRAEEHRDEKSWAMHPHKEFGLASAGFPQGVDGVRWGRSQVRRRLQHPWLRNSDGTWTPKDIPPRSITRHPTSPQLRTKPSHQLTNRYLFSSQGPQYTEFGRNRAETAQFSGGSPADSEPTFANVGHIWR